MTFNNEMKLDLPEDFKFVAISKLAKCTLGGTPSRMRNDYWNGNIPWIIFSGINADFKAYILDEDLEEFPIKIKERHFFQ